MLFCHVDIFTYSKIRVPHFFQGKTSECGSWFSGRFIGILLEFADQHAVIKVLKGHRHHLFGGQVIEPRQCTEKMHDRSTKYFLIRKWMSKSQIGLKKHFGSCSYCVPIRMCEFAWLQLDLYFIKRTLSASTNLHIHYTIPLTSRALESSIKPIYTNTSVSR